MVNSMIYFVLLTICFSKQKTKPEQNSVLKMLNFKNVLGKKVKNAVRHCITFNLFKNWGKARLAQMLCHRHISLHPYIY